MKSNNLPIKEICLFGILSALMFVSKIVMEALPNIHLLGMLTVTYTIVFRKKALIPIYVYVFLNGLFAGFNAWWVPYLYIWTVLWGVTMLVPKNMPKAVASVVYPIVCALHGLFFGVLYAPAEALLSGLDFNGMLAWIASGFVFDIMHAIGNFAAGLLIWPMSQLLLRLKRMYLH
jgi:energy-coupling factor transport system substrate-specific component